MRRNQAIVMSGFARPSYGAGEGAFATPIAAKASRQVAKAIAGSSLSDYRSAEDLSTFWYAPTSAATAFLKSSYWLAVASRLGGSGLASSAAAALTKGNAALYNPLAIAASSFLTSPQAILTDAGEKIVAAAPSAGANARQLLAIGKILGVQSTQVAAAAQRAWEQNPVASVVDATKLTAGQFLGTSKRPWYFWPAVIGIPLVVLFVFARAAGWKSKATSAISDVQRRARAAVAAASQ